MNLTIDIGNTLVKAALFSGKRMIESRLATIAELEIFIQNLLRDSHIDHIILSSVINHPDQLIADLASDYKFIYLDQHTLLPFKNCYLTPETLGKDRIAAVAGASAVSPNQNVLVIDAGTCIKYDFITDQNEYLGGGISPGIKMRYSALHHFTQHLPGLEPIADLPKLTGNTTSSSIHSGVQIGALAEVNGIINLSKQYKRILALNNLNLTVYKGQVFGLLGPNGGGKTTTINALLNLIRPTSGEVKLFGSSDLEAGRKRIGVTMESNCFYPDMPGQKNLEIVALIKGIEFTEIEAALKRVGLYERRKDKVKSYSLGMKQRLSIAGALMGDPELLIFDEPTNGLDPRGIVENRELLKELATEGKTILLASHFLSEMEKICSDFAFLDKGKLISNNTLQEVISKHSSLENAFMNYTA